MIYFKRISDSSQWMCNHNCDMHEAGLQIEMCYIKDKHEIEKLACELCMKTSLL